MQNYTELIREKYLIGSPKEQWEYLEQLSAGSTEAYVLRTRMETLLRGIKGTPDTATIGQLRNILEISLQPID